MMNPYEQKFKEELEKSRQSIARRMKSLEELNAKKNHLGEEITAIVLTLMSMISSPEIVIKTLEREKEDKITERVRLESSIEQEKVWLKNDRLKLVHISSVCPHVDTVYYSTDFHKNEDYHKCKLCGEVI